MFTPNLNEARLLLGLKDNENETNKSDDKDELQKYRNNLQIIYNYQIQVQYYDVELKVAI